MSQENRQDDIRALIDNLNKRLILLEEENDKRKFYSKLDFPLLKNDADFIKNTLFILREVKLSSGSFTLVNKKISPKSIGFITRKTPSGSIGDLRVTCGNGAALISSSSGFDNSNVYVLIVF